MPPATDRAILHFTDYSNLPRIVADGGLYPDAHMFSSGQQVKECADAGIKEARRKKAVLVHPYGNVGDYVPFYYAPRSPMMSAISHGRVPGYTDSRNLVYLMSSLQTVDNAGLRWVSTDGNARTGTTVFYNLWQDLEEQTDWQLMTAQYWTNTTEDGDRKRRRMAEFLVLDFFPLSLVFAVVAYSQHVANIARASLPGLPVDVQPDFYI